MVNFVIRKTISNRWLLFDMVFCNFAKFICFSLICYLALDLASEYVVLMSLVAATAMFSFFGRDQLSLVKWTRNKTIEKRDWVTIGVITGIAGAGGSALALFTGIEYYILFGVTVAMFVLNRFCLMYCYSQKNPELRFFANFTSHLFLIIGVIFCIRTDMIQVFLLIFTLGMAISSTSVIFKHRKQFIIRNLPVSEKAEASPYSIWAVQTLNSVISRSDLYAATYLLESKALDVFAVLVGYSEFGNLLPGTFNNVIATKKAEGLEIESVKKITALVLFLFFIIYLISYLIGYHFFFHEFISIQTLILLAMIKSCFFAGNILLPSYQVNKEQGDILFLGLLTLLATLLVTMFGEFNHVLTVLAIASFTRFVIFIKKS